MVHLRAIETEIIIGGTRCVYRRVDHCDLPQRLLEHRRELLGAVFGKRKRNGFQLQRHTGLIYNAEMGREST